MTTSLSDAELVNPENKWRLETTPVQGWQKDVRPTTGKDKYLIISCDSHLSPTPGMFQERIDPKFHDLLPRLEIRDGVRFILQPDVKPIRLVDVPLSGEDLLRTKAGAAPQDPREYRRDSVLVDRIADQKKDGVDGEVIFPNGQALLIFASTNEAFVQAQCRAYNDWLWEVCAADRQFCNPAAVIPTTSVEWAIEEVNRVAKLGYRTVMLPNKPIYGADNQNDPKYNLKDYDPLWAALQDTDLTITYHVSTGKDPRGTSGPGGAIINYMVHALGPTMEPVVSMIASGVFDRFPKLRAGTIEANAGWVPWMLDAIDDIAKKHHMWSFPKLKNRPSDYYRSNCFSSFMEDKAAVMLAEEYDIVDNLLWANDYPHHEGSWPHSAEAIERTLGNHLSETSRAKMLGLNAARIFRFDFS